uniref:Gypsy retrotransposon integrase-like protein 1 n=1 Tax=Salarias fasciatus TaxID=181472 RepID=A0A672FGV6_SALFA
MPSHSPHIVPVVVTNESEQDVCISPFLVIAELGTYECTVSDHHVVSESSQIPLAFNFGDSPAPSEWRERLTAKLKAIPEVFAHHALDFGCTSHVKHHINLSDNTPFKHRARPIHPHDIEAVRKHLQELLDAGVIRESESSFSSPIVVVKKKNGDVRLCIDYRKLNLQTIKDAYPLPNLEECFSALNGAKWFSVLDLKSGYYQIEMHEADKAKTAFVTPLGFWEFNRMPQGVTNAPSTFQRLMEKCMGSLHLKEVLVFIDDLIIFADTLEEHERRLLRVLDKLKEYGLKLSPDKCMFLQTSVRYLGHVVSEKGVDTDPAKVAVLKSWPIPHNLKTLRSFLGFAGYYRRFIKDYAAIVKPLNDLTRGYPPTRKTSKGKDPTPLFDPKQSFGARWTPQCEQAFSTLIDKLTTAPVLGFANPSLPYILHTDASTTGLGAALYQEQEGVLRVIAFASRGLSQSESRYPAHKLEFLALKWSVTEKFQDYLYGANFTVVTDSNPLTYLLTSAKLDATSHRWLAALSTFSFHIQYRAGKQNLDADALSRRPHDGPSCDMAQKDHELIHQFAEHLLDCDEKIPPEVVEAVCQSTLSRCQAETTLVESLSITADSVPDAFAEDSYGLPVVPPLSHLDLQDKQRADPSIREVIHQLEFGESVPLTAREELPELPLLLRELNKLEIVDGILYRRRHDNERLSYQLVLPEELRPTVLQNLHDHMGHMGKERTLDLARTRFYW